MRLMIGRIGTTDVYVEEIAKTIVLDGQNKLQTVCLRVVNDRGHPFITHDLKRMSLKTNNSGAHEIGVLCERVKTGICQSFLSDGMPYLKGKFLLLCAKVEEDDTVRVTFIVACDSGSRG